MIEIYAVKLHSEIDYITLRKLSSLVSQERQDKLNRLNRSVDITRSILSELLIRRIIKNKLGLSDGDIQFLYNYYGKPFLNGANGIHFNLSHSGDWVVCAVHNLLIGIDIEKVRPVDFSIAEKFFTREEYEILMQTNEPDRNRFFFTLWTLKESYIKAIGKGLSIPLNSFIIETADISNIRVKIGYTYKPYFFKTFNLDDYQLSICAKSAHFPALIKNIDINELLSL